MVWLKAWESIRVYKNYLKVSKVTQTQIFIPVVLFLVKKMVKKVTMRMKV